MNGSADLLELLGDGIGGGGVKEGREGFDPACLGLDHQAERLGVG